MSAAAPTAEPEPQPSRSGRLLALVRKLIDYGREIATTVRQRIADDPRFVTSRFGTADLAVIFTRITRGLLLAQALEERVLRRAAWLDKGKRPRKSRAARKPEPKPSVSSPAEIPDQPVAELPMAEQIAAEVRRRPIGSVLAEIYLSLGILPSHPLWRQVNEAMFEFGGSLTKLLNDIFDRTLGPIPSARALQSATPSGTGPP